MAWNPTSNPYWDRDLLTSGFYVGEHWVPMGCDPDPLIFVPREQGGKMVPLVPDPTLPTFQQSMAEAAERADQRQTFFRDIADSIETVVALKALKELWAEL